LVGAGWAEHASDLGPASSHFLKNGTKRGGGKRHRIEIICEFGFSARMSRTAKELPETVQSSDAQCPFADKSRPRRAFERSRGIAAMKRCGLVRSSLRMVSIAFVTPWLA
jgi:hypothetical protein